MNHRAASVLNSLRDRRVRLVRVLNAETNYAQYQWLRRELELIDTQITRWEKRAES